jgi:serine/threonine protein kinase
MADPVSEQPQPPPAQALGDFILLNRIGGGSQGEVWLAEDSLGRRVAVKLLFTSSHSLTRNREEAALRLYQGLSEEKHLLRVLHVGKSENGLFYSMELADSDETFDGSALVPDLVSCSCRSDTVFPP